eukprot:1605927-Amphidinium_carterae.1
MSALTFTHTGVREVGIPACVLIVFDSGLSCYVTRSCNGGEEPSQDRPTLACMWHCMPGLFCTCAWRRFS